MKKRKGFTLLELMLVMVIVAILAGAVGIIFGPAARKKAHQTAMLPSIKQIQTAGMTYYMENGIYTTSTTALVTADYLDPLPTGGPVVYTIGSDANGVWVQGTRNQAPYSGDWVKVDGAGNITYSTW